MKNVFTTITNNIIDDEIPDYSSKYSLYFLSQYLGAIYNIIEYEPEKPDI